MKGDPKIIPLRSNWQRKFGKKMQETLPGVPSKLEEAFLYTLDLLMEDFGKKHLPQNCVLCEPMKLVGKHRDEVVEDLAVSLFTTFFPSFDGYVLEMKESLLQGLLDRRDRQGYDTWKEKLKALLNKQIQADLVDFLKDIQKHLAKFTGNSLTEERYETILEKAMDRLQKDWIRKVH